jgi:hypothetical protein
MSINSSQDSRDKPLDQLTNRPPFRLMRGYAFDPSVSIMIDIAAINHAVF